MAEKLGRLGELPTSVDELKELIEGANDLICVIGADGAILYLNRFGYDLMGYKHDEVFGQHFRNFVASESLPEAIYAFTRRLEGKENAPVQLALIRKDGKKIYVELHGALVKSHGWPNSVMLIGRDITTRKIVEAALDERIVELQKSIEKLSAKIKKMSSE